MSGVCLDALNPAGCPDMGQLRDAGTTGARLVAFDNPTFFEYAGRIVTAGLQLSVVLARESFGNDDWAGWASFYAERCHPTYWVIGNEMDAYLLAAESPSSWKMTPEEYADFWWAAGRGVQARQPEAHLVIGGLVSGQPSYLDAVLPLLDPTPYAVDIHPYGRDAPGADELFYLYRSLVLPAALERFRAYREVLAAHGATRRMFCLEWNRPAHEIGDYLAMLEQETGEAAYFCWSDGMVEPFGLLDTQGNEKPEYAAFVAATGGNMTAIDDRAAQLGATLGAPLGNEVELQGGVKMRAYYNGVLVEIPGAGVYALSEATVADKFLPE